MRLTAELIQSSPSYINPIKDRELNLRGCAIRVLENLGATKDLNDCLDLSDNEIRSLGGGTAVIPYLPRLHCMLLSRNRISHISMTIGTSLPNLNTIVLTGNSLSNLIDLIPLAGCRRLTHISLLHNPVEKKLHYRYWMIWLCPRLRVLDFQKVKDHERHEARVLFGGRKNIYQLLLQSMSLSSNPSVISQSDMDKEESCTSLAKKILGKGSSKENAENDIGLNNENNYNDNNNDNDNENEKQNDDNNSNDINKNDEMSSNELNRVKLTDEDKERLRKELEEATSMADIDRIENALKNGYL